MKHIVKIITLFILIPTVTYAGELKGKYTKTKTINKEFTISNGGQVMLNNKYGSIDIETSNTDKVSLKIIITTSGNKESDVEEKLKTIDIEFEDSNSMVSAQTVFAKHKKSWSWFSYNTKSSMDIRYIVKMPKSCDLTLNMDYGDVTIDNIDGDCNIDCDYGKIYLGNLNGKNNDINLDYSRGSSIEYINEGRINIDYSSIDIEKANIIDLNSDYSDTKIDRIDKLDFNCDYGNIAVDQANYINGNSDYVNLKFGLVKDKLTIDADYGRLKVERMGPNFSSVDIDTEYTGVRVGVDSDSSFELIAVSRYSGISVPDGFDYVRQIEKSSKNYIEGTYNGSKGKMNITSQYGSVKIYKY